MSGTTPRPWFWNSYSVIYGGPAVGVDDDDPEYTVVVPFPQPTRGDITTPEGEANARLIVEAVNAYDRLRAIEAAARAFVEDNDVLPGASLADLRAALHPADKEAETSHE